MNKLFEAQRGKVELPTVGIVLSVEQDYGHIHRLTVATFDGPTPAYTSVELSQIVGDRNSTIHLSHEAMETLVAAWNERQNSSTPRDEDEIAIQEMADRIEGRTSDVHPLYPFQEDALRTQRFYYVPREFDGNGQPTAWGIWDDALGWWTTDKAYDSPPWSVCVGWNLLWSKCNGTYKP